jgi:hypothetical protein
VRPEPIDSTKETLEPPQIMLEFMQRYGTNGVPPAAALAGLVYELGTDDAETIQFGNTVFISHYSKERPMVYMRALNVDTVNNFVDNIENYVSYLYARGIKIIITNYTDPSLSGVIKAAHRRIEANNPQGGATLEFSESGDQLVATITQFIKGQ